MAAPGTLALLLPVCLLSIVLIGPTEASCPDVNTAVNCSFGASDSCTMSYRRYDQHGLKWSPRSGLIPRAEYDPGYGGGDSLLSASPEGEYMYVPATQDPRALGLWTDLVSPPLTIDRQGCLYFLFHNNVCGQQTDPGDIHFKVLLQQYADHKGMNSLGSTLVREYPCISDNQWYSERIHIQGLSGIFRIVFSAKQHDSGEQLIAVDHVIYTDESCSSRDDVTFEDVDCDFEDSDLCGYQREVNDTDQPLKWMQVQKEMLVTQLNNDVQAPEGQFLCLWGRDYSYTGDVSTYAITSPRVSIEGEGCLTLRYYIGRHDNDNGGMTALRVSVEDSSVIKTVLQEFPATLGNEPMRAFVTLPRGQHNITFSASVMLPYGGAPSDVIFLDDVEIHQKACDEIRCDDPMCEVEAADGSRSTPCSGRGTCVGRGLKHRVCHCPLPYMGLDCYHNPEPTTTTRPTTTTSCQYYWRC